MTILSDFIKATNNPYASITDDHVLGDIQSYYDTGSFTLNAILSGSLFKGMPDNKIVGFNGVEQTGKTFFCLSICKRFLDNNKDSLILYFDSEGGITTDILSNHKIDKKRFGILPVATVQDFKNQAIRIVDKYLEQSEKDRVSLLFVLDSLGMLSTTKEMADSAKGEDTVDMTRSRVIKAAFRTLTLKLSVARIPMILTNHVYDSMSMYGGKVVSGGSGSKYAASINLMLTKSKNKEGDAIVGNTITVSAIKSRLTKEYSKIETDISYIDGLKRYAGLLSLAEQAGIFKKVSTRYELPDGTKLYGKTIEENPEKYFTQDVLEKIDLWVGENLCYGINNTEETDNG